MRGFSRRRFPPRRGRRRLGDLCGCRESFAAPSPLEGKRHEGFRSDGGRALAPRADRPRVRGTARQPRADGGQALVALDRPDAVVPWVETYRKRLLAHPGGTRPIDPAAWREALGDNDRVGDWIVLFRRELEERPWKVVLAEWTARLSPGVVAAAFHGAIRTAHAVRSLEAQETPAPRAGARRGARVLGRDVQRAAGIADARRSRRPGASPPPRSPACRSFRATSRSPTATSPTGSRRSTRSRPSPEWPTRWTRRAIPSAFMSDLTETFATVYLASATRGTRHHVPPRRDRARRRADAPARTSRRRSSAASCATRGRPARRSPPRPAARPRRRRLPDAIAALARRAHGPRDRDGRRALHQVHRGLLPRVRAEPEARLHPRGDGRRLAARAERSTTSAPVAR